MQDKKLVEISTGNPSRRRFVIGGIAAASAAAWPLILIPGKAKAEERIVIPGWGGRYAETLTQAFYEPFTKATGIPVIVGPQPDFAKIKAMIKTGNMEYDLIDILSSWVVEGEREGLWEPIDTRIVDRTDVVPQANRPSVQHYYIAGGGIIYNEQTHGAPDQHPKNWREFWDTAKFPGRRCMCDLADRMLAVALMADGVDPQKVFPMDVDRAFKSLDRIKPHVKLWPSSSDQTISLLEKGESDFNFSYNGRVFASRLAGNPIGYVISQSFVTMGQLAVPKGSPHKEAAMKLVNFHLRPENQANWANIYGYMGTNTKCVEFIKPEAKKTMVGFDDKTICWTDMEWLGDHNGEITKRFKAWLLT